MITNIVTNADGSITITTATTSTYGVDIPIPILAAIGVVGLLVAICVIVWAVARGGGDSN